jgi:outer membrane protein OmpA-like peptidoglycan-associated protein
MSGIRGPGAPTRRERGQTRLVELAKINCDDCAKQYDDLIKVFASLDAKAQTAGTLCGLVIGFAAAFIKPEQISPLLEAMGYGAYILLALPLLAAIFGVAYSVYTTRLLESPIPYGADRRAEQIESMSNFPEQITAETELAFHAHRQEHWKQVLQQIEEVNRKKVGNVRVNQTAAAMAMVLLAILLAAMTATTRVTKPAADASTTITIHNSAAPRSAVQSISARVHFDWNRFKPLADPAPEQLLKPIVDQYLASKNCRIEIRGFADRSGRSLRNLWLSRQRADEIASRIVAAGIPRADLFETFHGDDEVPVKTAPGVREPENRTVEISERCAAQP